MNLKENGQSKELKKLIIVLIAVAVLSPSASESQTTSAKTNGIWINYIWVPYGSIDKNFIHSLRSTAYGEFLFRIGKKGLSVKHFERAGGAWNDLNAYLRLGQIYLEEGLPVQAVYYLKKAEKILNSSSIYPKSGLIKRVEAMALLADAYYELRDRKNFSFYYQKLEDISYISANKDIQNIFNKLKSKILKNKIQMKYKNLNLTNRISVPLIPTR